MVLKGGQFLIPLMTLPYLVRTVGIEKFGLINFALSLGLYFGAVIQYGFGITATRELARNRDNSDALSEIYSATLVSSMLLVIICLLIFMPLVIFLKDFKEHLILYIYTFIFIAFQSLFPVWFFQGLERMKFITILSLSSSCIFLISLVLFVKNENDYVLVPLLNSLVAIVTFVSSLLIVKFQFKVELRFPRFEDLKKVLIDGRHAFISQLAPNLYNNSSVFLLGLFAGNGSVGLYAAATKVIDAITSFGYILSNAFLPYLSRNLKAHNFFQKLMLLAGAILSLIAFFLSDSIINILFSYQNIEMAQYFQWLSLSIFFLFMLMVYSTNYLMLIGCDDIVKNISLVVSLVSFCLALYLIPYYGIYGAVCVILLARFAMAFLSYVFYLKNKNI